MAETHDLIHKLRKDESIKNIPDHAAELISRDSKLLCFDEMELRDIADAMVLNRLFSGLWNRGVIIVATSRDLRTCASQSSKSFWAAFADTALREFLPDTFTRLTTTVAWRRKYISAHCSHHHIATLLHIARISMTYLTCTVRATS